MRGLKAYEVDSFWIPVRDTSYPNGVRFYSLTKFPEIAVQPEPGIARIIGSFQPKKPTGTDGNDWIRDPYTLLTTLNTVATYPNPILT